MIKKTLYFSHPAYLSMKLEQLVVHLPDADPSVKDRTIPIEDIAIIVLDNHQITMTSGLLEALLENTCAVISCNHRGMPQGLFLPLSGNTLQDERFHAQLESSLPLRKQLWQQTMMAKIRNQAAALTICTAHSADNMLLWAKSVKSGDPDNLEARAAVYYWKNLFGFVEDFVRDPMGPPPNNLLNYGYAVLRAVVARALVASGLLPTWGIHHHNRYNAYCLADDIMEPYRPYVDLLVFQLVRDGLDFTQLSPSLKREMLVIPTLDTLIAGKRSPLMVAVSQTTASLAKCFLGEIRNITYPELKNHAD